MKLLLCCVYSGLCSLRQSFAASGDVNAVAYTLARCRDGILVSQSALRELSIHRASSALLRVGILS